MKALVAAATWAMPALLGLFVVVVLVATVAGGGEPDEHLLLPNSVLGGMLAAVVVLDAVLLPFYLRHLNANERMHPARRKTWAFWLTLYGMFAMPVYWKRYVRSIRDERLAGLGRSGYEEPR